MGEEPTTSTRRRARQRFVPEAQLKEAGEWLYPKDRAQYRAAIKLLGRIRNTLEVNPLDITPAQERLIRTYTDSDADDTRMNVMWDLLDKTEETYTKKLAKMAPWDLTAYHELINPHEPPAQHHIWLCEYLMRIAAGDLKTLLLSMPAGAAKSTYTSRSFVQWYMGKFPHNNVLAVGNSQKFVESEFSKPNREVMRSDRYLMAFPDVCVDESSKGAPSWKLACPDSWFLDHQWEDEKGKKQKPDHPGGSKGWRGGYYARGAGAGVLGIRANIVVGDDLFGQAEDALSEVIRSGVWRWWVADVGSRVLPDTATILVNTRYHSEDVIGQIEKIYKENPDAVAGPVEIINIPAEAEENDPLGREPGEWLWCRDEQDDGYYPISHYEQLRAKMPATLWSAVYQGKPLDQFGEFISEDKFQRYTRVPRNQTGEIIQWSKTVISVDTAAKGNERSDNTAIIVFRLGIDNVHYVVDCWAGKEPMEKVIRRLNKMVSTWDASLIIMEDSGMGATILDNYQGRMRCPMKKYSPAGKGAKDFRFDACTPWITSGRVKFPKNEVPWVVPLINEFVAFPNGSNDDRVDAFSQYFDSEYKNRRGGTKPLRMRG